MPGSIRLGRIAGIEIDINLSWLIILVLLTVSLAVAWFPYTVHGLSILTYWVLGLIAAILLFASVLGHELAHSLVAKSRGLPVKSITLFIFGGVSNIEHEPQSPSVEFWMAIVGPITSLVIGGVSWLLAVGLQGVPVVSAVFEYLAVANILLGAFNLIPGFPLDGGRVLRALLWAVMGSLRRATLWATRVGQFVAYLFILWGIWQVFTSNFINGIWIGFIGWFLLNAAQTANREVMLQSLFRGVSVAQVMGPPPQPVPANISLRELVDHYLLPRGQRTAPVYEGSQFVGLITLADVKTVPREQWDQTPVSKAMAPVEKLHVAQPRQRMSDILPLIAQADVNQLPVLQDGQLVGMLTRDAIVRYLDIRQGLGLLQPQERERRGTGDLPAAS
jgi:Zn-dependent protease/CBS domain-containing protein